MGVVSRTYAEALFAAAKEAGRLDAVRGDLSDFVEAVREVPELRNLLLNPQFDPRARSAAVGALLEHDDQLVRNFVRLLAEKGRAAEIEEIGEEFERLVARETRRLDVELITAVELSDTDAQAIVRRIEQASGRDVDATRSVDPDLIGGLVLKAGSLRADASVRGRLEQLRTQLVTARTR